MTTLSEKARLHWYTKGIPQPEGEARIILKDLLHELADEIDRLNADCVDKAKALDMLTERSAERDTLQRERDEARAALALALPRMEEELETLLGSCCLRDPETGAPQRDTLEPDAVRDVTLLEDAIHATRRALQRETEDAS